MSYSSEVLADSPAFYYRLGDASGTTCTDISGASRHATYTNSPTLGVSGAIAGDADTAVTFDGTNDFARFAPASSVPKMTDSWSVELWLKFTTTALTCALSIRAEDGLSAGQTFLALTGRTAGQLSFEIAGAESANRIAISGTQNDGVWRHFVCTYDFPTATFKVYMNGSLVGSLTRGGAASNATNRGLFIGSNRSNSTTSIQFFPGTIDEVAVYPVALSSTRIAAHYAAATPSGVAGGLSSETDSALAGSVTSGALVSGGLAVAANVALAGVVAAGALVAGGQASETDSARAGSAVTGTAVAGGLPAETDAALAGSVVAGAVVSGGQATEADSGLAGTVIEPPSGDVIVGGTAVESASALPGVIVYGYTTTVTTNRVGGISVGLSMPLAFEPVVDPAPARAPKNKVVTATSWASVTRAGTEYRLVDEITKDKRRLRERVIVGGKDVTYFRGQEVTAKWQLVSPLLYGPGSISFPKINTAYEVIGEGALSWLDEGKTVRVQLVNDADEVVETVYKGLITALDSDGQSLTAQTGGEASGRAALQWKPLPVYADPRSSAGKRAFGLVRSLGLDFNPFQGPDTPAQRVAKLGGMYVIDAIELLCRSTQRRDGTQFSVMPGGNGAYRFEAKDTTTVHATVYIDGARVRHALRSDIVDKPNRIYADAVTEDGKRLTGIVAPGIVQGSPPAFGGNLSLGDTGGQVPVLIDRLQGFDLLEVAEGRTGFDEDVEEAVKDLQDAAGLTETGVVNEATWNALFDLDITGYSLRLAHREPAAQQNQVARDRLTPTGAVIRRNPNYRAGIPKVDAHLDMGSGVSFRQRKRWAKAELAAPNASAWSGTLEINTGAVIQGNHHFGDPLTSADLMDFRLLKPGMNIMARGFQDEAGTLFHISGIDSDGKTLLVDTRARDTLHVWDAVQRRRDEDRWRRGRRASSEQKDVVGEWDGGGGGMLRNSVEVPAGTWTIFGVPAGDEGTLSRFKIRTNVNAEMCVAMFGGPLVPKALEQYLARKIETPLTEGGSDAWSDHDINQKLKGNGLLGVWGEHLDPGGYEPRSKSKGGDLTGVLADEAGVAYRTAVFPVLYVAVWADRDTTIPAGRIMWNQLEPGA